MTDNRAPFLILLISSTIAVASTARADDHFVFSAPGSSTGSTSFALGAQVSFVVERCGSEWCTLPFPFPAVNFNWAHGVADSTDFLVAISLGLTPNAAVGARYRLFADRDFGFTLAIGGSAIAGLVANGELDRFGTAGVMPGLSITFGNSPTRLTLGADVPIHILRGNETVPLTFVRASATLELAASESFAVYLRAQVDVLTELSTRTVVLGASW